MDLLKDAAKNLNLYEVKAYVRKAQNVAMNLTETESRVREATNNEPWGASTTLMSQIAAGTYNYREREEIVGFIFRRFTEKAANEWRQIYKSLQLLEYLIKNGSERIIDDLRGNLPLISMLKSFHYIDSKGRDQGINVRNRAKSLAELLKDDALIRSERKKARANAKKFGGVSSAAYGGASSLGAEGGSNYDEDYNGRVFGDGGVYGARYGDTAESYNTPSGSGSANAEDDWEGAENSTPTGSSRPTTGSSKITAKATKAKPQPTAPEQDLLGDLVDFNKPIPHSPSADIDDDDDDDFDDFQAAPSQTNSQPLSNNLANLYQSSQPQQQQQQQQQSFQAFQTQSQPSFNQGSSGNYNVNTSASSSGPAKASNNDAFSSLFSSAKTKTQNSPSISSPTVTNNTASLDDDFFSTPSTNTTKNSSNNNSNNNNSSSNNNNNNNSGEVDLLSF